ncbi:MAG: HU family DNA-binding protein [Oscillospiraceae bacterium]|nr:HU family DNA-binding protein [Oscillospiraceae bacterium]
MTKKDLVAAIAEKASLTKKDAEAAVNAFVETVQSELKAGGTVQLTGFGTFEVRSRSARKGLNPRTKEPVNIPATKAPAFKAGKVFKDAIAK